MRSKQILRPLFGYLLLRFFFGLILCDIESGAEGVLLFIAHHAI